MTLLRKRFIEHYSCKDISWTQRKSSAILVSTLLADVWCCISYVVHLQANQDAVTTGGDWTLDDSTISLLAAEISRKDMETIAQSYMKISIAGTENMRDDARDSAEAFNRKVLEKWRNKYSGPNPRLVSVNQCLLMF